MENTNEQAQNTGAEAKADMPHVEAEKVGKVPDDVRLASVVGYIPPLFFIPMFLMNKHPFALEHSKQALLVLGVAVAVGIVTPIVTFAIPFLGALVALGLNIAVLVLIVMGACKAYKGEMWEAPVIGGFAKNIKL